MGRSRNARAVENHKRFIRRSRAKARGVRRSDGRPGEGWTLVEFAQLAGVQPRTVRHYVTVGVLPHPPFRGTATRYGREHLLAVLAARRLQSTEKLSLDAIRRRLSTLQPAELESLATEHLPPGLAATALGIRSAPPAAVSAPAARLDTPGSPRWIHVELALGLELHVRDDASPRVIALAERLREICREKTDEARGIPSSPRAT